MGDVLARFSPATREWFAGAFAEPTPAQVGAWDAISSGAHALVVAPTGSGKTLAAFLWSIDRLLDSPAASPQHRTRVLYVSPLKALGVDVERNLRSPLVGVTQTAKRLGLPAPDITVGVRSGDTSTQDRRLLARVPPDILITTPESLYLMLTSAARETLLGVTTVIVDEVHAVAATKRGAHLAVSLERLDLLLENPAQRIGLSATVRPREEVARFLGGRAPVTIVAPPSAKRFDLSIVVPVDDMSELGTAPRTDAAQSGDGNQGSIWPHVEERIVDLILEHRSTIVFANSRRLAERLTGRLNELYDERMLIPAIAASSGFPAQAVGQSGVTGSSSGLLARAHHGSVSKDQRAIIEDDLKSGRLRCVVATSSLELGIDMGEVDLVVQVESPPSVASGLQRVGRAGHQVGEVSRGVLFPKHRADLIHMAVVSERMVEGAIEALAIPQNPLDILAQQTVAAVALEPVDLEDWWQTIRRSAPFATLPRSAFEATLDLLSGLYPSDEFAELRPRIIWDRINGTLTGRPGAQRLAVTSGGTIPDRGLFGVFMVGSPSTSSGTGTSSGPGRGGGRVGELDEEMVYESRVGDIFALGATSWRIEDITHDRVVVSPAFGQPGRVPFWKGDGLGRPAELGEAIGAFIREVSTSKSDAVLDRARAGGLDDRAIANLVAFIAEQKVATSHVPTDKTLVVERFRDELGDWRVILHSPYGMPVHSPWALAVTARVRERFGYDGAAVASDDGIIVRLPDTDAEPPGAELFLFEASELEQLVTDEVGGSALFASRFRECAARALLLPRYNPGRRSPLWQQRQRSAQLLEVARKYPSFPIVLETVREVLQDVYDLPSLMALTARIASRTVRIVEAETESASPFARSLLFGYVAAFMYEGDSPLAERRAAALSLDATLLAELLGRAELRELLDEKVLAQTELELQRLAPDRRAHGMEGVVDLLRVLGPLSADEVEARLVPDSDSPADWLIELERAHRVLRARIAGVDRWAIIEDASRLRDALGVALPIGVPTAFVEPVTDPIGDLVSRYARTHGPFAAAEVAARFGLGIAVVHDALGRLGSERRVIEGEFRPGATGTEWVDAEILRRLRSRSLAALRHDVEPVPQAALARFLPEWQHIGGLLRGVDGLLQVVDQLAGVPLPASALETLILPSRLKDYSQGWLDELTVSGEVLWSGAGALPGSDGWISLHLAESAAVTLAEPHDVELTELQSEILVALAGGGAYFFRQLATAVGAQDDGELATALWDLVWASLVTNDTISPLRAFLGGKAAPRRPRLARPYRGRGHPLLPAQAGPPTVAGRWSLLPLGESDPTVRAKSTAEALLSRHGIVTRGAVVAEGLRGGFALAYKVLSTFEETGRARRGYFVDGLGAAQFGTGATVDRLRQFTTDDDAIPPLAAITLAATDPANAYGAALGWPTTQGHRPARKAGSLVVLVDGALALYLERGGKTVLTFTSDPAVLNAAAASLANTVRSSLGRLRIERVDGEFAIGTALGNALTASGFAPTPQGLRLRG
ncbi:MAG TPA: ATP-dependent helicase [Galbitalea sp.]|jgi:ATP-dependent Lhr-like helicase|nr:ATP-dependent helicase [Galbitalea sp.]